MIKPVEELYEVIRQQEQIYSKLLELSRAKQPVLVHGKIEELDMITKQEETLIFQVGRLEEKRNSIQQVLADHFALSSEDLNAGELEKRVDKETAGKLRELFDSIGKTLNELTEVNKSNTELIQSSLEYINFSLNLLTGDDTPSYGDEDRKQEDRSRLFDQKI